MCKFASLFFIHQLHLMLLFNVSVTYIAAATAGDHSPVQNSSNPNQKRSDAFSTAPSTSSISAQAAGSLASDSRNLAGHLEPHLEPHLRFNSNLDTAASNYETNSPRNLDARLVSKLAAILDASNLVVVNDSQTNFSNEHSSVSADMRTNLDHLNELNNNNRPIYTDQYVVQLRGGPELARELTERHGFVYLGQIFDDHYHIKHRRLTKRSLEPAHADYHRTLINEPNVAYLQQQTLKRRVKRDFQPITRPHNYNAKPPNSNGRFNDPQWNQMWYLQNKGLDMNVQKVWDLNITGKGIVVTILDDGLEKDHPDIANNYDANASYDVNNLDPDPQPRYDMLDSNRHGTRCAGEVAAMANNNICGVGIAFDSKIGGVRMLDGDVTDAVEARSLSLANQHIHIYSASWGPDDDGKTVDGPGELATRAFIEGVTKGRAGLGSIFIWASGNGGREHDNCNCDGYTNSIWTLSISSATENGLVPWYSEACSSTLATTYSSGAYGEKQIITTDLHHRCTNTHTGTSASAPLAAGIAALVLQANPRLTWRDMQHLVVQTANPGNLQASDWRVNGVGKKVSHSFGYGLMDAQAMVQMAKEWITVPSQKICETRSNPINRSIPFKSYVELSLEVHCDKVKYLEHVQAKINLTTNRRGDIHIYLISPSGTRATLVAERAMDNSRAGFVNWPFMSVHSWGEQPDGKWKLEIHNEGKYHNRANLKEWTLIMYGTSENPDRRRKKNTPPAAQNAQNGRTGFTGSSAVHVKNEGHRLSGAGRLDSNALNEMKPVLLNRTRINSIVFKPTLSVKPNEQLLNAGDRLLFDGGKNASGRLQLNNANSHPPNTVSNDLGLSIYNPPDNAIDTTHTSNHQLTDAEPFGTNDIDKSTRAEKTGNERSKAITNQSSKDQLGRLGNRLNSLQQSADAPVKSIKSDGRGGNLGDYENQAAESSTAGLSPSQNKIAYDCKDNFYFHGNICVKRCPDNFYSYELVANLDALNTPIENDLAKPAASRRASTEYQSIDEFNRFRELKEPRKLKEFAEPETAGENRPKNNHPQTTSSAALNSSVDSASSINQSNPSNETSTGLQNTSSNGSSTTPSSTTLSASIQPTTLPPFSSGDTIQINPYIPYSSHYSIKQKDLNKLIWLKQQELRESFASYKNSLYQKLVQESERYEDSLQQSVENDLAAAAAEKTDEKLERISICLKCHYTCRKCTGRKSNQCTACYQDSQLDADSGRCLFRDLLSDMSKQKSTSDLWPSVTFDSRVQNWITIFSLLLCLFFSVGFFYLLLCRRDCPHKSFPELQQYNAKHASLSTTAEFYHQTKLCTEPLAGHESGAEPIYEQMAGSFDKPSFFISFLRFFKLNRSACGPKSGPKTSQLSNPNVKYNNIPLRFEMVRGGELADIGVNAGVNSVVNAGVNETGHEEIT